MELEVRLRRFGNRDRPNGWPGWSHVVIWGYSHTSYSLQLASRSPTKLNGLGFTVWTMMRLTMSKQQAACALLSLALSISPSLGVTAGCFTAEVALRQPIAPTTFKACYELVKGLVHHDKAEAAMIFSRKPGAGFRVPEHWVSGNCVLTIDMDSEDDEELTSFKDLAVDAGTVMVRCVMNPPHLGGTILVGRRQAMNVTVFGYRKRGGGRPLSGFGDGGMGPMNATTG
ncbi:MAG: hypothetical protein Q9195_003344 [Heterodermia aff. obscurata]